MIKKLILSLVALASMLPAFGQAVQTPTLQGNYHWTGQDLWPIGQLGFITTPTPCPNGQVVNGLTATLGVNCVPGQASATYNWATTLTVAQGSSDTTFTGATIPAGITLPSVVIIDSEYEEITAVNGNVATVTRAYNQSTAAGHSVGADAFSQAVPFGPTNQYPLGGVFYNGFNQWLSVNCGNPYPINDGGNLPTFQANCGGNETWIDASGRIHQANQSVTNYMAPIEIHPGVTHSYDLPPGLPINDTNNVVQTTGPNQLQQQLGFSSEGVAGALSSVGVSTIPAPTLSGETGTGCNVTYVVSGVAADGTLIPGTPATINALEFIPGTQGLIDIQTPQVAGIVTYNVYRTVITGTCGSVTLGKFATVSNVVYPWFQDNGFTAGDGNSPPATNNSIGKMCTGTFANPTQYCSFSGTTSTPSLACNAATYGWDYNYIGATASPGGKLHCYTGATSWTAIDGGGSGGAIASINSDTTPAQVIQCSGGGCSITQPSAGHTQINITGGGLTGTIGTGTFAQLVQYAATGTGVSAASNMYYAAPGYSLAQLNGLFSRFSGTAVTSYSITSNVVTMQGSNSFNAGDTVDLLYFPTSTFFNNNTVTILSTGLSNTQFEFNFTHANVTSTTEAGWASYNVPAQPVTMAGTVFLPPNFLDNPATAFVNQASIGPAATVVDLRRGHWFQDLSAYGVKYDAQQLYVTLTSGSDLVNVGSSLDSTSAGKTLTVGCRTGFGNTATQQTWTTTIQSYTYPNLTLLGNAPFSCSTVAIIGTNNQAALTRAFKDASGFIPLYVGQGGILTDTVRWNGTSLIGNAYQYSNFFGIAGHDIFQQQDGVTLNAWSINASTGVTTFTIPNYAAHNVLVGDSITLENFPTATFFNGNTVTIASHPTPTTITVNNVFSQSTSSGTDVGLAQPTTGVNVNGLQVKNLGGGVNNSIDSSFSWTEWNPAGTSSTTQPGYDRPLMMNDYPVNNPFGTGWGSGTNGVASITANSTLMCVPTATGSRQPTVGNKIIFPYQGAGLYTGTVASTTTGCSGSNDSYTLSPAVPNNVAFTSAQAEWWQFTSNTPQTVATAIPASITLPYTVTLAIPFPPAYGNPSNVASHGHIIIGSDEWDYMGTTFGGTAGGNPTITLRSGSLAACGTGSTCTVNGGAGDAVGSVVFPLNNCQLMYNNPYPVVPTLNSGKATPVNATYYPSECGGNAFIALPASDAVAWTPFNNSGFSLAIFDNIDGFNTNTHADPITSNQIANDNGTMLIYEQGNNSGYDTIFRGLRVAGLWQGPIAQGPASVNQHGVRTVGPTSTGQTIADCTVRSSFGPILDAIQQSHIPRCDGYSTETSQYDGTSVGAATGLFLGYTSSEQDGGLVTNVAQIGIGVYNSEPENGNHYEYMPSVVSDASIAEWGDASILEGGVNFIGGSYQIFHGPQLSNPSFNYGKNNYFEHLSGLNTQYFSGIYDGSAQFFNWGDFTQGECSNGSSGGANTICFPGAAQGYNGHDAFATLMGDPSHPNENLLGGMVLPGEMAQAGLTEVFDMTEPFWGRHTECTLGSTNECILSQFDGFNGYINIGPHQRVTNTKTVLKFMVKSKTASSLGARLLLSAQNPSSNAICTSPNYNLAQTTFTAISTAWTPVQMPVDFTNYQGCALYVQFDSGSTSGNLEIGYFNFVPFTGQLYIPLGTHNVGDACPVAGEISVDSAHLWTCQPSSGVTFGAGTWQEH